MGEKIIKTETKLFSRTVLFSSITALTFGVGNAFAQDTQVGGKSASWLEEVVVTAQKREQSADDIGMSISAIGGEAMDQLGVTNTADLSLVVPGFTYADTGLTTPVYTLRGVGFNESSVQATSTVGVYNDQIAVPFPIMTAGLQMDMQRVEVLKGPQGTLYGRNSTGGAVNYIANRPSDEFEGSIEAEYGRFETFDVTGVVSGPLSDRVGARFAFRTVQSGEGWQKSVSRDDTLGEQDRVAARLLVDITPTEDLDIKLALNSWSDDSESQAPQFLQSDIQRPDRPSITAFYDDPRFPRVPLVGTDDNQAADWSFGNTRFAPPQNDMSNESISATINYSISDSVELTSLTAYSKFENNSSYDNSGWQGVPLDAVVGGISALDTIATIVRGLYDDVDRLGAVAFTNQAEVEAFSQELRLSGANDSLNWLAGVYYSDESVDSNTPQLADFNTGTNTAHLFFGLGLQATEVPSEQDGNSWAVFGHTEWSLSDQLNLTVGLRYTEDEKEYSGCTADNGDGDLAQFTNAFIPGADPFVAGECVMFDGFLPALDPFEDELEEDSVSGRLALDYDLNEDSLLYASYSRGFKSGSYPTLTANQHQALEPVVQEQLDAFELGFKTSLADNTIKLNAAAFYYDYTDKQLLSKTIVPIFGPANALANVPESSVTGAEFDLAWQATDNLYISFGATFVDTEVEKFQGFNQVGIEGDFSGSEFPLTPDLQAFLLANYDFSLGNDWKGFINTNVSYSSESYADYSIAEVLDSGLNGPRYAGLLARNNVVAGDSLDVLEPFVLPSTTLVGANIGFVSPDDKWTISIWGRNLTDEYIRVSARKSSDAILGYTGRPRTYGITASYEF
jgi:outer membrane receptor protein involved in Fe transport